jgi:hypothetical protein
MDIAMESSQLKVTRWRKALLGSDPGGPLRVAVVTPYFKEPEEILGICHQSVLDQSYACTHILVADGFPSTTVASWNCPHIVLPASHADAGNTPRAIGSLSAAALGFDAIAFLDADNWYKPEHIQSLIDACLQSGAEVCASGRDIHRLDGSLLLPGGERGDGVSHIDTSCMLLTRPAFGLLAFWTLMPRHFAALGDRLFWAKAKNAGHTIALTRLPTLCYRTPYVDHYLACGETPPAGVKTTSFVAESIAWWEALPAEERAVITRQLGFDVQFR